jgi:hypothetical protein
MNKNFSRIKKIHYNYSGRSGKKMEKIINIYEMGNKKYKENKGKLQVLYDTINSENWFFIENEMDWSNEKDNLNPNICFIDSEEDKPVIRTFYFDDKNGISIWTSKYDGFVGFDKEYYKTLENYVNELKEEGFCNENKDYYDSLSIVLDTINILGKTSIFKETLFLHRGFVEDYFSYHYYIFDKKRQETDKFRFFLLKIPERKNESKDFIFDIEVHKLKYDISVKGDVLNISYKNSISEYVFFQCTKVKRDKVVKIINEFLT